MRKLSRSAYEDTKGLVRAAETLLEVVVMTLLYYGAFRKGYEIEHFVYKGKYVLMGVYGALLYVMFLNSDCTLFGQLHRLDLIIGQVISLFPMQAGTPNIDWLQQHISLDADLGRLEQAIAAVEPGSGGVFWQPYLNGERAPFYSPDARAGFFGISPHTTRAELQRAVFEGLAFAIVDALQGYPQGGELYLTGGGAASATWLQIIADCTGRTVVSSAFNELSARGAAILAARSVAALAETPPLAQTRYQPRPQAHARYAALYPVYRLLREQMLPVWQARQAALQPLSQDLQP